MPRDTWTEEDNYLYYRASQLRVSEWVQRVASHDHATGYDSPSGSGPSSSASLSDSTSSSSSSKPPTSPAATRPPILPVPNRTILVRPDNGSSDSDTDPHRSRLQRDRATEPSRKLGQAADTTGVVPSPAPLLGASTQQEAGPSGTSRQTQRNPANAVPTPPPSGSHQDRLHRARTATATKRKSTRDLKQSTTTSSPHASSSSKSKSSRSKSKSAAAATSQYSALTYGVLPLLLAAGATAAQVTSTATTLAAAAILMTGYYAVDSGTGRDQLKQVDDPRNRPLTSSRSKSRSTTKTTATRTRSRSRPRHSTSTPVQS